MSISFLNWMLWVRSPPGAMELKLSINKENYDRIIDNTVSIPEMGFIIRRFDNDQVFWNGKNFSDIKDAKVFLSIREVKKECQKILEELNIVPVPVIKK